MLHYVIIIICVLISLCILYIKPSVTVKAYGETDKPLTFKLYAVIAHVVLTFTPVINMVYYVVLCWMMLTYCKGGRWVIDPDSNRITRVEKFINKLKSFFTASM